MGSDRPWAAVVRAADKGCWMGWRGSAVGKWEAKVAVALQQGGCLRVKRYGARDLNPVARRCAEEENPYWILETVEMKTDWHAIGL